MCASYSKLSKELKKAPKFRYAKRFFFQLNSTLFSNPNKNLNVLIHNLKAAWPTKMLMPFYSSLDNLL